MPPARHPVADAFVGRDEELSGLLDVLTDTAGVGLGPVLVSGEAGIGKSRFMSELAERLPDEGTRIVRGRAWDDIDCPPYWPWVSAMREVLGRTTGTDLREMVLDDLDDLDDLDRFELFDATTTLLQEAAADQPLVVMLDDLHVADRSTLLLTRFVASELLDQPVTVVAAHRPVDPESHPDHHQQIEALAQDGVAVPLTGLDVEAVAELVPEPDRADDVHAATGGNPLFVHQVARLSAAHPGRRGGVSISDALHTAIRHRLAALSPPVRHTLAVLSALGASAEAVEVATVSTRGVDEVLGHLEALAADGLTRSTLPEGRTGRTGRTDRVWSVHASIASTVLDDSEPSEVREIHRRAASFVADRPERRSEYAHHLLRSGEDHLDAAVGALVQAAEAATAIGAHDEAAELLRRAVDALESAADPDRPRLAVVMLELGRAERRADRLDDADLTFARVETLADELGDHQLKALAVIRGGIQYFTRHDRDAELLDRSRKVLDELPMADSAIRARVLADVALRTVDVDASRHLAAEAVDMARRVDDPVALGSALITRSLTDLGPSAHAQRLVDARELAVLARRSDDPVLAVQGRFLLFGALVEHGDLRGIDIELRALGDVDDSLVGASVARFERWMGFTRALLDADLARAEQLAVRALELAQQVGDPWGARIFGAQMGTLRWVQGRGNELAPVYEAQLQLHPDEPVWAAALAYVRAREGRDEEARELLARALPFDRIPRTIHQLLTMAMSADAAAMVGDDRQAHHAREHLLPFVDRFVPINLGASVWGPVARPLGLLALRLGRIDEGIAQLRRSVQVCARLGARPWTIEAQLLLAGALGEHQSGSGDEVSGLVVAARASATELGLEHFVAHADRIPVPNPTPSTMPGVPRSGGDESDRHEVARPMPTVAVPSVSVLGTFEVVSDDGRIASWNSRKARELLKFLVAKRGAPVHREVVMDLLWPDVDPAELSNRYAVVLNTVRRALDPDRRRRTNDLIATDRDAVRLCLDQVEVDAEVFLDRARRALASGDAPASTDELVAAAELHRGPALPDEPYADWAIPLRDEVRLTHLRVVRALADRAVRNGDHLAAADAFRQLVEADPLDADVHEGLTEALRRLGAAAAAESERSRFIAAARERSDRRPRSA